MVAEFFLGLIAAFGYAGVFLASLIGNASIILPLPSAIIIFFAGKILDPLLVGVVAAIGGAIGEMTAYALGAGGNYLAEKKKMARKKGLAAWFTRGNAWFRKHNGFLIVFAFSVVPLPHDVIGIICGAIKYDWKKFFAATLLGKIILYTAIAYAGFYGVEFFMNFV